MNNQTRQSYDIDNRRAGTYASAMGESWAASDNEGGNQFLQEYLAKKRVDENPNLDFDKSQEDRFFIGSSEFLRPVQTFKNQFRASQ